jgi:hypothetical protein
MPVVPAPVVKEFSAESIEKRAYNSVRSIPTREPNDEYRLGYHVWRYLAGSIPTLEEAVHMSYARMSISEEEAVKIIREKLGQIGVDLIR